MGRPWASRFGAGLIVYVVRVVHRAIAHKRLVHGTNHVEVNGVSAEAEGLACECHLNIGQPAHQTLVSIGVHHDRGSMLRLHGAGVAGDQHIPREQANLRACTTCANMSSIRSRATAAFGDAGHTTSEGTGPEATRRGEGRCVSGPARRTSARRSTGWPPNVCVSPRCSCASGAVRPKLVPLPSSEAKVTRSASSISLDVDAITSSLPTGQSTGSTNVRVLLPAAAVAASLVQLRSVGAPCRSRVHPRHARTLAP